MPTKPDYLQLEAGDDATRVRDKMTFLRGKRVLIVWPQTGSALTRKLDLVLVQREAARLAVRLAFVTHEPEVIQHARELGISVFETVGASERRSWKRGRGKLFASRAYKPDDEPDAQELMPVASRRRSLAFQPSRARPLVQILTLMLIIAAILGAIYVIMPSATVTLTPAQARLQAEALIVADPNTATGIDIDIGIIPATLVQIPIEDSATIPTTGTRDIPDAQARGVVIFINQTDAAVDIPAGTLVSTSAGTPIQYQTTQAVQLAGGVGLQVEAPVEALPEFSGSIANVGEGLINTVNGDLAQQVVVRNLSPTTGGEDRSQRSVTQQDQESLLFSLRQQLQSRACDEMTARIDASKIVLCDTMQIIEERSDLVQYSANIGDTADELTLTMRIVVQATAVDQTQGQQVAFARLAAQIPRGLTLQPETIEYAQGVVLSIDADGRVGFMITASGLVIAQIDPARVSERIAGRNYDEALAYLNGELSLQESTDPQLSVFPDWLPHLPLLPFRISVRVERLP
jgi:hypothetical protein